jgi:hypothetical protein
MLESVFTLLEVSSKQPFPLNSGKRARHSEVCRTRTMQGGMTLQLLEPSRGAAVTVLLANLDALGPLTFDSIFVRLSLYGFKTLVVTIV